MKITSAICFSFVLLLQVACAQQKKDSDTSIEKGKYAVTKTDEEWRKLLGADSYNVMREEGTERAFTGKYWDNHKKGTFVCKACGLPLFESDTKFESGTGWPSFYQAVNKTNVQSREDQSFGMVRSEVHCSRCGGHLGHVFDDGPKPTGLRYCINSASLQLQTK